MKDITIGGIMRNMTENRGLLFKVNSKLSCGITSVLKLSSSLSAFVLSTIHSPFLLYADKSMVSRVGFKFIIDVGKGHVFNDTKQVCLSNGKYFKRKGQTFLKFT